MKLTIVQAALETNIRHPVLVQFRLRQPQRGSSLIFEDKGMIKITGRYKELIIGEGGENIAPVPIEEKIQTNRWGWGR